MLFQPVKHCDQLFAHFESERPENEKPGPSVSDRFYFSGQIGSTCGMSFIDVSSLPLSVASLRLRGNYPLISFCRLSLGQTNYLLRYRVTDAFNCLS